MIDLVILTDKDNITQFSNSNQPIPGFIEDALLREALEKLGLKVERLAWDDPHFDWSTTKSVIFRSTWDYFYRYPEFSKWLNTVAKKTRLLNSKDIIRWNINKRYLLDLKTHGINIAETFVIARGSQKTLVDLHQELRWSETVLKPCVSGTARHTYKLNAGNLNAHEAIYKDLIENEDMMLQPFQYSIVDKGEVSLMFFGEHFSHAVLKTAKKDEFRVQSNFGGSVKLYEASDEEILFGEKVLSACPELPSYARVDIFIDNHGNIALSELELIEPELWYRLHPESANLHAKQLYKVLVS